MTKRIDDTNQIINYIENKIKPLSLSEIGKANIAVLLDEFSVDELYSAIDKGFRTYIELNDIGEPTEESVGKFLSKIGGIAHNNSLSPIDQKIRHIKNICNKRFNYWDDIKATVILNKYVRALRNAGWTDESILFDLNNESMERSNECTNWTQWRNLFEGWTESLENPRRNHEGNNDNIIKVNKEYEILEEIGYGSFGITYLCKDKKLGKFFVIKRFTCGMLNEEDNKKFFDKFIDEILSLFDLHHQNIVSIYDYLVDLNQQNALYIMEYINGLNIEKYLENNKDKIDNVFEQIIDAFNYLETKQLCHRDIRIDNILVNNFGEVKVIDFGFVKNISDNNSIHSATKLISYPYDWPKELKDKKQKYDIKTDIYFIGKLFEDLINRLNIKKFKYNKILDVMIEYSYHERISSFSKIKELMVIKKYDDYIKKNKELENV